MTRAITALLAVLATAVIVAWLAANTEWIDGTLPMPARGEAATNPFYAAQSFAEKVGARVVRAPGFPNPSRDAVVVLSGWYWSLSLKRAEAIKRWVEAGGRLVVDDSLVGRTPDFERWSGVSYADLDLEELDRVSGGNPAPAVCRRVGEAGAMESEAGKRESDPSARRWLCDVGIAPLTTGRTPAWMLADQSGRQVVRMATGRGSVTVINAKPFTQRRLFDGDHAWLFVEATQLRKGDEVFFLSEDDYPSLLELVWLRGASVVVLGLALIGTAVWRRSDRHGPLAPGSVAPRRSLAEQLRGTGQFLVRYGGEALHAAAVRALDEASRRQIDGYARLGATERLEAVAALTNLQAKAIQEAVRQSDRSSRELRSSLALLETARRRLAAHQESRHGVY
jgi:hypothetical protein